MAATAAAVGHELDFGRIPGIRLAGTQRIPIVCNISIATVSQFEWNSRKKNPNKSKPMMGTNGNDRLIASREFWGPEIESYKLFASGAPRG